MAVLNTSIGLTHHASNYWVCDGIIQDSQQDKTWGIAAALQEEMLINEEIDSGKSVDFPYFVNNKGRWILAIHHNDTERVKPETTSLLFLLSDALPGNFFQRSEQLHVLKLYGCYFRFSSPPFLHCKKLRFLGLDGCMDQPEETEEEDEQVDRRIIDFFSKPICARPRRLAIDFIPKYDQGNGNKH